MDGLPDRSVLNFYERFLQLEEDYNISSKDFLERVEVYAAYRIQCVRNAGF